MNIKKAVQRIGWRFGGNGNKKPFPVNENDIEAYNFIVKFVKKQQEEQYKSNQLFAKLYVYLFTKILEQDKSTVFDNNARRKIGNLLKKPLHQIIDELKEMLNDSEMYELFDASGIELKHPAFKNEDERDNDVEKLKNAVKDSENDLKLKREVWDYDTVEKAVISEVNQMINIHGQ